MSTTPKRAKRKKLTLKQCFVITSAMLFIMTALFLVLYFVQRNNYAVTEGVIERIVANPYYDEDVDNNEPKYIAYVRYAVGDNEYSNVRYPTYNRGMYEGMTVKVSYLKSDPTMITSTYTLLILTIIAGVALFISIVVMIIVK